jgi:pimeloyl-ACP methyl ester carboxylesterase
MHAAPARPRVARTLAPFAAAALSLALVACGGGGSSSADSADISSRGERNPVALQNKCRTLVGKSLDGKAASVTDAKVVEATGTSPEYCVAQVKFAASTLRFEVRLPTSGWNEKLAFLGGGGFDGNISHPAQPYHSASIRTERYATMATNGGYDAPASLLDYFKAGFAADPVKLDDFTHLSEHRSLPVGKELIRFFYAQDVQRAYFEGCSMGGHDAMIQAQRFPDDFDGIVARAPAGNIMGLFMQFNRIAKQVRNPAGQLNTAKQTLLANAVLAQCDGLDGAVDGIIGKPAACNFDPQVLRCTGGTDTGDSCLSDAQIATATTVTSPIAMTNGAYAHTGYFFGGENHPKGWGEYIWPNPGLSDSLQGLFSDGFIRSFITRDPTFNTATWDANNWASDMARVGALFSANDPDLSGLRSRGAKLVMWNGTTDTSVSPKDNARYYDSVVSRMGKPAADDVVELFQAPGVGHCFGGAGPDQIDLLKAVVTWVEQGTAPSAQNLLHRKLDANGATTMARPVCKYPAYPRYKGSGDLNDPASFACSTQ